MVEPLVVAVTPLRFRVSIMPSATEVSSPPSSSWLPLYLVEETVTVSEPRPPRMDPTEEVPDQMMVSSPTPPSTLPVTVEAPVTVMVSLPRPPSILPPMVPVVSTRMVSPMSVAALLSLP